VKWAVNKRSAPSDRWRTPSHRKGQEGLAGLSTAIVLIAFVVVGSVLAYTMLSSGVNAVDKSKQAIYEGLRRSQSSLAISGRVMGTTVVGFAIDSAESGWTAAASVTATTDTTDYQEGLGSLKLTVSAGFTTGYIARKHLSSGVDVSDYYTMVLRLKSDTALNAGVLSLMLYNDTGGSCGTLLGTFPLTSLPQDEWRRASAQLLGATGSLADVDCIAIGAISDPGAVVLRADLFEAPDEVQEVIIPLQELGGNPIDVTPTTDTDSDGLWSDETTLSNRFIVSYHDEFQLVHNLAWSFSQPGKNDGDAVFEAGEQGRLVVSMRGVNPVPTEAIRFVLTLRPDKNAEILVEKIVPKIQTVHVALK